MKIKLACCKNSPFRNFHYTRSEKIQKEINWHTIKSTNKLFYFLGKNSKFFEKMNVELTKKGKWSVVDTYKFWNLNLLIIKFDGLGSVKVSFSKNEVKMPIWKQCQSHFSTTKMLRPLLEIFIKIEFISNFVRKITYFYVLHFKD